MTNTWKVLVKTMWLTWGAYALTWIAVSAAVLATTGDFGSFVGGGIVVALTGFAVSAVTLLIAWLGREPS